MMTNRQTPKFSSNHMRDKIQPLSEDEIEDAEFAARDGAWVAVASLFDEKFEKNEISYQILADRIGRKKSQVHRWLKSSSNITLKSLGLLAAGMDSTVEICLKRNGVSHRFSNACHPSIAAAAMLEVEMYSPSIIHSYDMDDDLEEDFAALRTVTSVELIDNV